MDVLFCPIMAMLIYDFQFVAAWWDRLIVAVLSCFLIVVLQLSGCGCVDLFPNCGAAVVWLWLFCPVS